MLLLYFVKQNHDLVLLISVKQDMASQCLCYHFERPWHKQLGCSSFPLFDMWMCIVMSEWYLCTIYVNKCLFKSYLDVHSSQTYLWDNIQRTMMLKL